MRNGVDGTAACGQHRVQHNYFALGNVLGQLAVVFHRLQRLLVAVQANVPHLRGGNQRQHAVHHAKARAQNGHQGQLAAREHARLRHCNRRLDGHLFCGQISCGLIAQQHRKLAYKRLELFCAGVFISQKAYLVLYKRMVENHCFAHYRISPLKNLSNRWKSAGALVKKQALAPQGAKLCA